MSASATEAVIAYAHDIPAGRRATLFMLAYMCEDGRDGAWTCAAAIEEIADRTGAGGSTTRRHLAELAGGEDAPAALPWIFKTPTYRSDGGRDVVRYTLNPEALDPDMTHRSKWARGGVRRVNKPEAGVEKPGGAVSGAVDETPGDDRNERGAPLDASCLLEDSPSFLPSFFTTDALLAQGLKILLECGPGLGDWRSDEQIARSLGRLLPLWLRDGYDFERDILPVMREQTAHNRRRPVTNFVVFEPDLKRFRTGRLKYRDRVTKEGGR